MKIIRKKITKKQLIEKFLNYFKTFSKVVVDIEKEIIAVDAELHSDLEALLLENGSKQKNLWGINLYPFKEKENFIEYTALINIRPSQNNPSMEVESQQIRKKIENIVHKLIVYDS